MGSLFPLAPRPSCAVQIHVLHISVKLFHRSVWEAHSLDNVEVGLVSVKLPKQLLDLAGARLCFGDFAGHISIVTGFNCLLGVVSDGYSARPNLSLGHASHGVSLFFLIYEILLWVAMFVPCLLLLVLPGPILIYAFAYF